MIIPIVVATLAYPFYSLLSFRAKSLYIKTKFVYYEEKFFNYRRKVNWIYSNFIFSYSLSILYITFFHMLCYELIDLSGKSKAHSSYIMASLALNLIILFYIFAIFCS